MSNEVDATAQVTTQAEAKSEQTQGASKSTEGQTQEAGAQNNQQPAETKETKASGSVVPEKYEFTLPENSPIDDSRLQKIAAMAKERGLTQEQAQAVLDSEVDLLSAQLEQFEQLKVKWADDAKADPEIGGEKFKENVELAHRVLKKFGSESFNSELERTGYGNHPELVRVFVKIGKQMAEDQMVIARAQGGEQKSAAELLYGTTKP